VAQGKSEITCLKMLLKRSQGRATANFDRDFISYSRCCVNEAPSAYDCRNCGNSKQLFILQTGAYEQLQHTMPVKLTSIRQDPAHCNKRQGPFVILQKCKMFIVGKVLTFQLQDITDERHTEHHESSVYCPTPAQCPHNETSGWAQCFNTDSSVTEHAPTHKKPAPLILKRSQPQQLSVNILVSLHHCSTKHSQRSRK